MLKSESKTTQKSIVMDPNWNERGGGKSKRGADRHYKTATKESILKTIVWDSPFNPDYNGCSLWCWVTVNHLPDALWLLEELGSTYVTNAVWVKAETAEVIQASGICKTAIIPQAPGLGQRMRMCHELLLYSRIGRVPVPAPADRMPSVIYAPRAKHSQKPQEAFDLIERHDGFFEKERRLELYARSPRDGWTVWGDEVENG